ncbi:histidinol-phosphatase HisJ family protein [Bacteroides sp. 214]|uniref:histidinol-phosphatase n=1 Tax=Bacteroides sp. 214 TaxID=2302935 RepID=UPI0013D352E6|nr:histidinol-phosphatase [Bacteroides sp. 214]NDW11554.1 histidinol-phosphatase HisJ family protein [Bacteroides sp. 214]
MNLTNYHTHCSFCDGKAPLEEFVQEAIAQKFTSYGVSSHAPLPFSTAWTINSEAALNDYFQEFYRLKEKYSGEIELYLGLEIDYMNDESNPASAYFQALPLDYRIGSLHMIYNLKGEVVDVDCGPEKFREIVDNHFDGDLVHVINVYYQRLTRMVELGGFDILGHPDKIHHNAMCYRPGILDESWYENIMNNYFQRIAAAGCMLEVNTKAYFQRGVFFPNERYFSQIKQLGIPVVVNSDAHLPKNINDARPEALAALLKAGYTEVMELHGGEWKSVKIGECKE